ncbi:hypothetical protein BJY01DRAFT_249059 [Aspergillus pseudoustus]|uniref:Fungal-specific transcription factor domain-containing protein n=1 Tax=Aspergillus pseudoustus TaxID=1810923 RepID=A0ABR4JRA0_9EURO
MGAQCIYDRGLPPIQKPATEAQTQSPTPNPETDEHSDSATWPESPLATESLGGSYIDPFHTYPSSLDPESVNRVLTFTLKEVWPKMFPGYTYKGASFIDHWIKCAMNCPPLFNAWLHSGAGHMKYLQQASDECSNTAGKDSYEMLLMEREALLGLKEFVDSASEEKVSDEIIMATLSLALHTGRQKQVTPKRKRSAPLSDLQLLLRFTNIPVPEVHVLALRHLVEARGGFDKIEMPGLKEGLSTYNLVVASKLLARPFWPLHTRLGIDETTGFLSEIEQISALKDPLHPYLISLLPHTMTWEFNAVRGYNTLVKNYSQGFLSHLKMGYVIELRNFIHYHVMSLPAIGETMDPYQELPPTYGALRLGLMAYSLLVLFPAPLGTDPHPRIAGQLRYELELTGVSVDIWMPMVDLLLWVLMLGGISAADTEHRPWYVEQIQWLSTLLGLTSWDQVKDTMTSILWIGSPCDVEGQTLWQEVQQANPFATPDPGMAFPAVWTSDLSSDLST